MHLHEMLTGADRESTRALKKMFSWLQFKYQLAWYPSAGNDYRDLMQLSPAKAAQFGITDVPDIFIHTDYSSTDVNIQTGVVWQDDRTMVEILSIQPLRLYVPIQYYVDANYAAFGESVFSDLKIYLLNVQVQSNSLGSFTRPVIYFLFENFNFLSEVVLQYGLEISHMVKVREGLGFGGNRKSISSAYAFFSAMKKRYLFCDNETDLDWRLIRQLQAKQRLYLKKFTLTEIGRLPDWSGFRVKVLEVAIDRGHPLTEADLDNANEVINS